MHTNHLLALSDGSLQYLDSGLDSGLDPGLDHRFTALRTLIKRFLYNSYHCLADLHSFLVQDVSHLNNIYDKCLMKSFHGADADDESDRFYLRGWLVGNE